MGWAFFTSLPQWATDHLALRQAGVRAAGTISTNVFGDPPGSGRGAPSGPIGVSPGRGDDVPEARAFPPVLAGKHGWLYLGKSIRNKCRPVLDVGGVIKALQRLRRAVESSGRQFELVIAPDKSTFVPEYLPDEYVGERCSRQRSATFWSRVPTALDAIQIRPALNMTKRRTGQRLYGPRGTHWSYAAGLTMTKMIAERLSPGSSESWRAAPANIQPWPADLARFVGRPDHRQLRTYTLAPNGNQDRTRYIASDFKAPLHLSRAQKPPTPGTIERPTAVVADSFAQFATPFLAATFQDLTIVHNKTLAKASREQLAKLLADRDVIVFEFVERSVAGGASLLLRDAVLDRIARVLAAHPR